jgi:L-ascorbate metabolism protein UlaG (beta-lactamase superfamily)
MSRYTKILLPAILLAVGCGRNSKEHALEVTYIANEGFMISMGSTNVLIDALPRSKYYLNPSDSMSARLMNGIPPFDKVDYVLVTHHHPDHFNAEMISRFLLNHPAAQLIASSETCNELIGDSLAAKRHSGIDLKMGGHQTVRGDRAEIVVLRLNHVGAADLSNFAFVVRSNGYTFVHVGDARLSFNEEYLRTVDWGSYSVDLLFIEYFDESSETWDIVEKTIRPKHVILMHVPGGEEDSIRNVNARIHPRTVVFGRENEIRRFDNAGGDESLD